MNGYGRLRAPRWGPATRRQPPGIPPAQAFAWAPKSLQFLSLNARNLRGRGVGLLSAL